MYVKFVIFAALSLSLVTAVYVSSVSEACARVGDQLTRESCTQSKSNPQLEICCAMFEGDQQIKTKQLINQYQKCRICATDSAGERRCEDWFHTKTFDSKLTENLQDFAAPLTNDTKPPKTDLLQDGTFVGDESINDTNVPRHLGNPKYGDTELNDPGGLLEEDNGDDITKPPKDLGGLNEEDLPEPDQ